MKYLIWLVVVFAALWWIRQKRKASPDDTSKKSEAKTRHTDGGTHVMVPCAHCGAHMPHADALQGRQGSYCSEAHRQRQES